MKIYVWLVLLLVISGCSKVSAPLSEYRVTTDVDVVKMPNSKCSDKSLKIASAFSSDILASQDMSYVQNQNKEFIYTQSQWATTPNQAITAELLNTLRKAKIFKFIQNAQSRTVNDLMIETNIEYFMQHFEAEESYGRVQITLALIDSKTSKIIDAKTFQTTIKAKTLDAKGGVEALNKGLGKILKDTVLWLNGVCK